MKEMTVEATLEQIKPVTDFINAQLEELGCSQRIRIQVDVAVDEIFGNIARYAYNPETGPATVCVDVEENPLSVIIRFIDRGIPYDPLSTEFIDTTRRRAGSVYGKKHHGRYQLPLSGRAEYPDHPQKNISMLYYQEEATMSSTIFEKKDSTLSVWPEGRLDTATSPVLEKEVREQLDGVQHIIMDFAHVEYISSGGLRALLTIEKQIEERDGDMRLLHVNANIMEIFELVGFTDVITVVQD